MAPSNPADNDWNFKSAKSHQSYLAVQLFSEVERLQDHAMIAVRIVTSSAYNPSGLDTYPIARDTCKLQFGIIWRVHTIHATIQSMVSVPICIMKTRHCDEGAGERCRGIQTQREETPTTSAIRRSGSCVQPSAKSIWMAMIVSGQ